MKSKAKFETRWDTINGLRIFTRLSQPGTDTLVLVHGLAVSSRYMVPVGQRLAESFAVYAPDLPGYGKSEHPSDVLNIRELAQALCDWMDRMGLERVSLLGNSLGCQVAARFALHYPERTQKLIFTGPTMDPRFRSYPKIVIRALFAMLFEPVHLYPILLRGYLSAGPKEVVEALNYAFEDPMEAYLPHIKMPVLVIRGERDWIASRAWTREITSLLPDGRMREIPGGAHAPNYDSPAALAKMVEEFLG